MTSLAHNIDKAVGNWYRALTFWENSLRSRCLRAFKENLVYSKKTKSDAGALVVERLASETLLDSGTGISSPSGRRDVKPYDFDVFGSTNELLAQYLSRHESNQKLDTIRSTLTRVKRDRNDRLNYPHSEPSDVVQRVPPGGDKEVVVCDPFPDGWKKRLGGKELDWNIRSREGRRTLMAVIFNALKRNTWSSRVEGMREAARREANRRQSKRRINEELASPLFGNPDSLAEALPYYPPNPPTDEANDFLSSRLRSKMTSKMCFAIAAFRWISLTLPPSHTFSFSTSTGFSAAIGGEVSTEKSEGSRCTKSQYLQAVMKVPPGILRSMRVKETGGVALLLHAQGLCDGHLMREALLDWREGAIRSRVARKYRKEALMRRAFSSLALHVTLERFRRVRRVAVARVMLRFYFNQLHTNAILRTFEIKLRFFNKLRRFTELAVTGALNAQSLADDTFNTNTISKNFYRWKAYVGARCTLYSALYLRFNFSKFRKRIESSVRHRCNLRLATKHYINRRYFCLWRNKALLKQNFAAYRIAKERRYIHLVFHVFRAAAKFSKRLSVMKARNRQSREEALKRRVFAAMLSYASLHKTAMKVGIEHYRRLLGKVLREWSWAAEFLKHERNLDSFADLAHRRRKLGRAFRRVQEHAVRERGRKRHLLIRSLGYLRENARQRRLLSKHLLNFTIRVKVLPRWRHYVLTNQKVAVLGRRFHCRYFFNTLRRFAVKCKHSRITQFAVNAYRDYDILFRYFGLFFTTTKRRRRLRMCGGKVVANRERIAHQKYFSLWWHRTARLVNARHAADQVESKHDLLLARGVLTIWRSKYVFLRNTRLDVLQEIFDTFVENIRECRRESLSNIRADRLYRRHLSRTGVKSLILHSRNSRYQKMCEKASSALHYKLACQGVLRRLVKNTDDRRKIRNAGRRAVLFKGFKHFRSGSLFIKQKKDKGRKMSVIEQLKLIVRENVHKTLVADVHFRRKMRSTYFVFFKIFLSNEKKVRAFLTANDKLILKRFFQLLKAYRETRSLERATDAAKTFQVALLRNSSTFLIWWRSYKLAKFLVRGLSASSNKILVTKLMATWRANARFYRSLRRSEALQRRLRNKYILIILKNWREFVVYAAETRTKIKKQRMFEASFSSLLNRSKKHHMKRLFSIWVDWTSEAVKKNAMNDDFDYFSERIRARSALRHLHRYYRKRRLCRLAASHYYSKLNKNAVLVVRSWHALAERSTVQFNCSLYRRVLRRLKNGVIQQHQREREISRLLSVRSNSFLKIILVRWRNSVVATKVAIVKFAHSAQLLQLRLALEALRKSPDVRAMRASLIWREKIERRLDISTAFAALRRRSILVSGFLGMENLITLSLLSSAKNCWSSNVDELLSLDARCLVYLRRWRKVSRERAIAESKALNFVKLRRSVKIWINFVLSRNKIKNRRIYRQQLHDSHILHCRERLMKKTLVAWVAWVIVRFSKRAKISMVIQHRADFCITSGFKRWRTWSSSVKRERWAKKNGIYFYHNMLLRKAFDSLYIEMGGDRNATTAVVTAVDTDRSDNNHTPFIIRTPFTPMQVNDL